MNWSDEEAATLARLWSQGLSAAEIGRRMAKTRNAVLGRVHRDALPRRAARVRKMRLVPAPSRSGGPDFPGPIRVPLLELKPGQCARPLWDDAAHPSVDEMIFCGRRISKGARFSFCAGCAPRLLYAAPSGIAAAAGWTTAPWTSVNRASVNRASPPGKRRAA